jgi:hypothetical protein
MNVFKFPFVIIKALKTPLGGALVTRLIPNDGGFVRHSTVERGNQSRLRFAVTALAQSLRFGFKISAVEVVR